MHGVSPAARSRPPDRPPRGRRSRAARRSGRRFRRLEHRDATDAARTAPRGRRRLAWILPSSTTRSRVPPMPHCPVPKPPAGDAYLGTTVGNGLVCTASKTCPVASGSHAPVVTVVGDAILDRWWMGGSRRLSREAPAPIVELTAQLDAPGGAANAAMNLRAIGAVVRLVDRHRHGCRRRSAASSCSTAAGVDVIGVVRSPDVRTVTKTRIVADEQVLVRADENPLPLPHRAARQCFTTRLAAGLAAPSPTPRRLVVSDYGSGLLGGAVSGGDRADAPPGPRRRRRPRPRLVAVARRRCRRSRTPRRRRRCSASDCGTGASGSAPPRHPLTACCTVRAPARSSSRSTATEPCCCDGGEPADAPRRTRSPRSTRRARATRSRPHSPRPSRSVRPSRRPPTRPARGRRRHRTPRHVRLHDRRARSRERVPPTPPCSRPTPWLRQCIATASSGRRIVFTNGCFDVLHLGHTSLPPAGPGTRRSPRRRPQQRRVGSAPEGPTGRPVNGEADRAAVVGRSECVDYVTVFDGRHPHPAPARPPARGLREGRRLLARDARRDGASWSRTAARSASSTTCRRTPRRSWSIASALDEVHP